VLTTRFGDVVNLVNTLNAAYIECHLFSPYFNTYDPCVEVLANQRTVSKFNTLLGLQALLVIFKTTMSLRLNLRWRLGLNPSIVENLFGLTLVLLLHAFCLRFIVNPLGLLLKGIEFLFELLKFLHQNRSYILSLN
jgi:hypothetical protein